MVHSNRRDSNIASEEILVLNAISLVSARMARRLAALANQRQSAKGGKPMSKMADMAMTIEELRSAAAAITDVADWLTRQFSGETTEEPTAAPEPEAKPAVTLEQVRAVLADKSRAGHTAAIRDLLQKYGATKLSQVDPKYYEALLRDAEVLDNAT